MNIVSVGSAGAVHTAQQAQSREIASQVVNTPQQNHGRKADTVEISASRSSRSAMQRDNAVKTVSMQSQMLRRMVERIIKEQYSKGNHLFMLLYGDTAVQLDPSLRPEGMQIELPDPQQRQAVENAVQYFSPIPTAQRILGAAEDVAGGAETLRQSPATVNIFQNAVQAAFLNTLTEAGGNLPELTQKTFEVTMQGFSDWKGAGEATA